MANKKRGEKRTEKVKGLTNNSFLTLVCVIVITIVTYSVFSPALKNGFTNWDDPEYVLINPLVVNHSIPVSEIFKTPVVCNYHPVTMLTLAWNYQDGNPNAKEYHCWNLVIHLLNTVLVFFFIFFLTRRNLLMAGIVALFFGIHPMHVESVAWISERKDVLYVFFFLSGLLAYLQYRESKKIVWFIITFLFFILSCLSKAMAVVFPVVLLLVDYLWKVKGKKILLLEKIPFFLVSLVLGVVAYKVQNGETKHYMEVFSTWQRIMVASYGAIMYLAKLFVPHNLSAFYPYPVLNGNENIPLIFYLSPFIFTGFAALVYFFLGKEKEIVFGLLFYFVSVALVLQFVSIGNAVMADRYSYLSYIGLLFAIAFFIDKVWEAKTTALASLKYPVMMILIVGALAFSYQTYSRTHVWKNSETLWADVIEKYPGSYFGYQHRGDYYNSVNEQDKAQADYTKALQLNDNIKTAYVNRGYILFSQKKYDLALADYNKAIALDSTYLPAYFNRGIYYQEKQFDQALADFTKCLELNNKDDRVYNAIGVTLLKMSKYEKAIDNFSKAIDLKPEMPAYWLGRSFAENSMGRKDQAKADALKAQELGMQVDTSYLKEVGVN